MFLMKIYKTFVVYRLIFYLRTFYHLRYIKSFVFLKFNYNSIIFIINKVMFINKKVLRN